MIEGAVFIGAVIIALTQLVKLLAPNINGALTIAVAAALGVLIALIDTEIGVVDLSVAEGVLIALGAVGVHTTARQVG